METGTDDEIEVSIRETTAHRHEPPKLREHRRVLPLARGHDQQATTTLVALPGEGDDPDATPGDLAGVGEFTEECPELLEVEARPELDEGLRVDEAFLTAAGADP